MLLRRLDWRKRSAKTILNLTPPRALVKITSQGILTLAKTLLSALCHFCLLFLPFFIVFSYSWSALPLLFFFLRSFVMYACTALFPLGFDLTSVAAVVVCSPRILVSVLNVLDASGWKCCIPRVNQPKAHFKIYLLVDLICTFLYIFNRRRH